MNEQERLKAVIAKIEEVHQEKQWYQEELLGMVEDEEQGTALWEEYRENFCSLYREIMELRKQEARLVKVLKNDC